MRSIESIVNYGSPHVCNSGSVQLFLEFSNLLT